MWLWEISLLKFPIPTVLDLTGCRKCRFFFLLENVWKSVRNYMEVIEDISRYMKNKISKLTDLVIFRPYAKFNCPLLKISPCDLFPVLLECIKYRFKVSLPSSLFNNRNKFHWPLNRYLVSKIKSKISCNFQPWCKDSSEFLTMIPRGIMIVKGCTIYISTFWQLVVKRNNFFIT